MTMTLSEPTDAREWNDFVRAAADSSFVHLWEWREVIHGVMGHAPVFRVARESDGGRITAALPLYRVRTRVFGDHLISVPFMNYGGPFGNGAARQALATWAQEEARRIRADSLLLRTRTPIAGFESTASKVTVVLQLPATADQMWSKSFDAKFRNKIKRPQRDGMSTTFGHNLVGQFYEVFARNMRDLGTPVLPLRFFQQVIACFPTNVVVGATTWNGRTVAAGFGFTWRDEFEMTWSSSLKELRAAKPNMLLYWDFIRELIGRGTRRFNFGRSTPGSGTHEFKLSWGAADEPLPWVRWPESGSESGESRAAALASTVWRRLPLSLTNALGPTLARQLPWW